MNDVNTLLMTMHERFNPTEANGMDETFQYDIEGEGTWQIVVKDDKCSINQGDESEASVILSTTIDVLASVISGETDGMQEFMSGNIKATGDIMLATRLTDLFPIS